MAKLYILSPKASKFIFDELRKCDSSYKFLPRGSTYGTLANYELSPDMFHKIVSDIEGVLSCIAVNLSRYDMPLFKGSGSDVRGEDFDELALPDKYVIRYEMDWEVGTSAVTHPEEAKVFIGPKLL